MEISTLKNKTNIFWYSADWCNPEWTPTTPEASRWKAYGFLEMRPHKKRPEVAPFRVTLMHLLLMQGPFLLATQRCEQLFLFRISQFWFLYTHLKPGFPVLAHTIESTLHSAFVASSKMLISGNQETVCCLLITSDCTAHYVSEVNYQQNEGKMGPQSRSSSHQFSTCGAGVGLTSYLLPLCVYSILVLFTCIPCLLKLRVINVTHR